MGSLSLSASAYQGSASVGANFTVTVPSSGGNRFGYRYRWSGTGYYGSSSWSYVTTVLGPQSSSASTGQVYEGGAVVFEVAGGTWNFDNPDATFGAYDSAFGSTNVPYSPPPSPPSSPGVPTVTVVPVASMADTWDITVSGTGNRKRIVVIEDAVERQVASSSSTSALTYRYTKPAGKNVVAARGEQWNYFNSWDGSSSVDSRTIQVTFGGIGWGIRL